MPISDLLVESAKVASATLVINHLEDLRVRHRTEDVEIAFGAMIGGSVKSTNVEPTAPPQAPRLSMRQGGKILTLSNTQASLVLSFQDKRPDLEAGFAVVKKNAVQLFQCFEAYQPQHSLTEIGIIIELNYRTEGDVVESIRGLAASLYKGPTLGRIVSFDLKLGFDTGSGLFENLALSAYEIRTGNVTGAVARQGIDLMTLPVQERGLSVVIDVNNRPTLPYGKVSVGQSFSHLLDEAERLSASGHKQFLEA